MGARFLKDGLVVTGCYTAFSNKNEKVLHMKLKVMRLKTKNNMNFQPE